MDDPILYHCKDTRSLRALWALEEIGVRYQLELMAFPPRFKEDGYKEVNPLGTVPAFTHCGVTLTESVAICQYLADLYPSDLSVAVDDPAYGDYLNWLHRSDATLTFPLTLVLRYKYFEPDERKLQQVVDDYSVWFLARLRSVEARLQDHDYLVADRFTMADITVGYALYLASRIGLDKEFSPSIQAYLARITAREGFKNAQAKDAGEPSVFDSLQG